MKYPTLDEAKEATEKLRSVDINGTPVRLELQSVRKLGLVSAMLLMSGFCCSWSGL